MTSRRFATLPWLLALCMLLWAMGQASAGAAEPDSARSGTAKPLVVRVATLDNPPYASPGRNGPHGISIAVFNAIAAKNGWAVEYLPQRTLNDLTNAIISHQADIGIGGITPTPELALVVDFSDANQIVPLDLLVKKEGVWSRRLETIQSMTHLFVSSEMLLLILVGLVAVLIGGYVIRLIERRRDPDMFPREFRHNAWWAAQTLVAHNCGSKLPSSERGRYVAMLLMLGGTVFTAEITAVLTTSLAASFRATAPITSIGDVESRLVATVRDSYAKTWLQQNLINLRTYRSVDESVTALEHGQVSGVVSDELPLRRVLNTHADLEIVGDSFGSHPHAFMVVKRSPLLPALNQSIAQLLSSQDWAKLRADGGE
ncbi:transporter substrate-binding domain-containing protein [Acidisoma cellulosilytica]|uniref:Transporter substrate-binding domain-containing protein n=1 Tax=Acidisoma cellulosilyticum TaxID=2802395 RepID=A0A964E6R4_9PROT|nr:transporter substrate-binding domain-containing protein [Acidisoma cellulosilyticum]MCB8883278.1 transporter substrate-binding domain-containing protein [Acidisoma cellulosilyticum]